MNESEDKLFCSFCGKNQQEVRKLIAGPAVYICDECVSLCSEINNEEKKNENKNDIFSEQSLNLLDLMIKYKNFLVDENFLEKVKKGLKLSSGITFKNILEYFIAEEINLILQTSIEMSDKIQLREKLLKIRKNVYEEVKKKLFEAEESLNSIEKEKELQDSKIQKRHEQLSNLLHI